VIQNPAILSLTTASLLTSLMLLYAGYHGLRMLARWDLNSGSELQLSLERRTYLISVIVSYVLVFQIISLFLYIFTADNIHNQFVGAMCAAGSLSANSYGYPTLIVKIINCLLAGIWLILNHADRYGYDYPLVRIKYGLLTFLVPLVLLEAVLQFAYFSMLKADVITSCCGSLFSTDKKGIASELAGLPHNLMIPLFYLAIIVTFISAVVFYFREKGGYLLAVSSGLTFVIALASIISFISLYYYELPTHHCPFCILQKEYGNIGYLHYATLLCGAVTGVGVGALMPFRRIASLEQLIPALQRKLTIITAVMYLLFSVIVTYRILVSSLRLG
jgi:hypothetical protein